MKVLELFCGTKSFAKVAKARGHETFTIDIDPRFEPDMVADIGKLQVADLPEAWRHPDVVWASPPCQCFSVMVISKNWESQGKGRYPKPKREQTIQAMEIAKHTIELIKELRPGYYFIENPRAMLRKMPFMQGWHHSTVTYCQYGLDYQKATDIWNNCYDWRPRPVCSPRSPCHVRAPRGAHAGLQAVASNDSIRARFQESKTHPLNVASDQWSSKEKMRSLHPFDMHEENGWNKATERAIVPAQLCEEIIIACEKGMSNKPKESDK